MKFLVDENLPREVPDLLRSDGHDAVSVADRQMTKTPDPTLGDLARAEGRAIITFDLDFTNPEQYPPAQFEGLVVLRLGSQGKSRVRAVITALLPLLKSEELKGKLWIVEDDRIRIR